MKDSNAQYMMEIISQTPLKFTLGLNKEVIVSIAFQPSNGLINETLDKPRDIKWTLSLQDLDFPVNITSK